ncbi:MAG TPA: hypothetical protein PLU30_19435 [Verrucomicrobiae bacterium]|nr:hypothetical protein [Verrucomicrobiae bacterium]
MTSIASRRWRAWLAAALLLGGWGAFKLPLERALGAEQVRLRYGGARVTPEMRDLVSQGAAMALLSGFRGAVADYLWVVAHTYWEQREWFRMHRLMELVCLLQPRSVLFWDMSSWHMAWNIAHDARNDPDEPRLAKRLWAERKWIDAGRQLLQRGVENIPDRYELWARLAWLLDQRVGDHAAAAENWRRAASFPGAPAYASRQVGYQLEMAGKLDEAYRYWRELWAAHPQKSGEPFMLWDRIADRIRQLEDRLQIPPGQRLDTSGVRDHR